MSDYSLKRYFDGECARRISVMLEGRVPGLDADDFAGAVDARVEGLELKDRVLVITEELRSRLPGDYLEALAVLVGSLGPELGEDQGMFTESWFLMPVARFVEEYGTDYPHESLAAIEEVTRRHTGEYAIRPYLRDWYDLTMDHVRQWARSPSHNVRRLASEGIRPRLPWARQFQPFVRDPTAVVEVVSTLADDPSAYVRTSVANNLNDISKDHPDYAVATALSWLETSDTPRTRWIVARGLRTLVRQGHPEALAAVGAQPDPSVSLGRVEIVPSRPRVGQPADIEAVVLNDGDSPRDVIADYTVHFLRPDGSRRPTTFRLGRVTVPPGERATLRKKHTFKHVRTRTLHPGEHLLTVQANGTTSSQIRFHLDGPADG